MSVDDRRPADAGPRIINGLTGLAALESQELGVSPWVLLSQTDVSRFADVTRDHQWIHVDTERATSGPFGGTIAHGYLTLALLPALHREVFRITRVAHGLNYGLDRVRFPAPLRVGRAVRAIVTLAEVVDVPGGIQARYTTVLESDAGEKPVCVADSLVRYYPEEAGSSGSAP